MRARVGIVVAAILAATVIGCRNVPAGAPNAAQASNDAAIWLFVIVCLVIIIVSIIGIALMARSTEVAFFRKPELDEVPWLEYQDNVPGAPLDVLCKMLGSQEPLLSADAHTEIMTRMTAMPPHDFLSPEDSVRARLYRCLDENDEALTTAILKMIIRSRDLTARKSVARFARRIHATRDESPLADTVRTCLVCLAAAENAPEATLLRASASEETLLRPATSGVIAPSDQLLHIFNEMGEREDLA